MATGKLSKDGDKVVLKLTFEEAAALFAILSKVDVDICDLFCDLDESTSRSLNDSTIGVFAVLQDLQYERPLLSGITRQLYGDFIDRDTSLLES